MINEKLFDFDMQRFNDVGVEDTSGTTSTEDSTVETTVETNESTETTQDSTQEDEFEFALDEDGNLVIPEDSEESEQPKEEEVPKKPLTVKVKVNGVEEEKTIDEVINGYQRQEDYTRKTQELARERAELEQLKAQIQTPKPVVEQPKPKDVISKMASDAMAIAKKSLDLDDEDQLNEYEPLHMAAYNRALFQLQQQEFVEQQRQVQYAELLQSYKAKEPDNYEAIDSYAHYRLTQEMPRAESDKVLYAIQTGKIDTVKDFIEQTRVKWYEKNLPSKAPVETKTKPLVPPKVESAGVGTTVPTTTKTRDMNAIKGKPMDDVVSQLVKWGLA